MSKNEPIGSSFYVNSMGECMRLDEYEWGHINTRVGKVSILEPWETQAMEKTATNPQTSGTAMAEDQNSRNIRAEAKHGQ
jgi:hypothetical protein